MKKMDVLISSLLKLEHTGANGFEGLVAELLQAYSNIPFRLARSGSQHGRDAQSDKSYGVSILMEAKHYSKSIPPQRELLGEFTEAVMDVPDLDCWILATTQPIPDGHAQALQKRAEQEGVEIILLDSRIDGLDRLGWLCAQHADITINFVKKNTSISNLDSLKKHLASIKKSKNFQIVGQDLERLIQSHLFGFEDTRRRINSFLKKTLESKSLSHNRFNQDIAILDPNRNHVIPRNDYLSSLNSWWLNPIGHIHSVLLGEEGLGKSWIAIAWLYHAGSKMTDTLIIPIIDYGKGESDILSIMADNISLILKGEINRTPEWWYKRLRIWLVSQQKIQILLFLDGLNQMPLFQWRTLISGTDNSDFKKRLRLLMTSRPAYWRERINGPSDQVLEIPADKGYSDTELTLALQPTGLQINDLSPEMQTLLRKPRFCDLFLNLHSKHPDIRDVTPESLLYHDYLDRESRKHNTPLTASQFDEIIAALAKKYKASIKNGISNKSFNTKELSELLPPGSNVDAALQEIIDGGLFKPSNKKSTPHDIDQNRLVYGLGMLLYEEVANFEHYSPEASALIEGWLDPHPDMDIKGRVLTVAVFFSINEKNCNPDGRQALLHAWLGFRNLQPDANDRLVAYLPIIPDDILKLADDFWRSDSNNNLAQERLARALLQRAEDTRVTTPLDNALSRWVSYVHVNGDLKFRPMSDGTTQGDPPDLTEIIGHKVTANTTFDYSGYTFLATDDDGLLRLSRFATLILSAHPRYLSTKLVLIWALSRALMGGANGADQMTWVFRQHGNPITPELLASIEELIESGSIARRKAARLIAGMIGSRDSNLIIKTRLEDFSPKYKSLEEHELNPCASIFAITFEQFVECLNEDRFSGMQILDKGGPHVGDPTLKISHTLTKKIDAIIERLNTDEFYNSRGNRSAPEAYFEQHVPVIARFSPESLINAARRIAKSIYSRAPHEIGHGYSYLIQWTLCLSNPELDGINNSVHAIREKIEPPSKDKFFSDTQLAESYGTLLLAPHRTPHEVIQDILSRSEESFDLIQIKYWSSPITEDFRSELLKQLNSENRQYQIIRILWILSLNSPSLSNNDIELIKGLIKDENKEVQSFALRLIYQSSNNELIKHIINGNGIYKDSTRNLGDEYGSAILIKYDRTSLITELAQRLSLNSLGKAVLARGCSHKDISAYESLLDNTITRLFLADPEMKATPDVIVQKSLYTELFRHFYRTKSSDNTINIIDPDYSWGGVLGTEAKNASSMIGGETREDFARRQQEMEDFLDKIFASEENQLSLIRFDKNIFKAILDTSPHLIRKWTEYGAGSDPSSKRFRIRAYGFLLSLLESSIENDPVLGFNLWEKLRSERAYCKILDKMDINELITIPFRVRNSDLSLRKRLNLLDDCTTDKDILEFSLAAHAYGQHEWIKDISQKYCDPSESLYSRAKGLTLASLSNIQFKSFEALVEKSDIQGSWVIDYISQFRTYSRHNEWAKYWYGEFIQVSSTDAAQAAYCLFLEYSDRRALTWMSSINDNAPQSKTKDYRLKYILMNGEKLKKSFSKKEKELNKVLFGIKIPINRELLPWAKI